MFIFHYGIKLKLFYLLFIKAPKIWLLPKKNCLLIYDGNCSETLWSVLGKYRIEILYLRGENINIPSFMLALLNFNLWKGKPIKAYAESFIRLAMPAAILTNIDNNPAFYELSKKFGGIKTIFVQNGTRGKSGDLFDYLTPSPNYHVDYMLVHGKSIGRLYSEYISGKSVPIGSFQNNGITRGINIRQNTVLFISQWRRKPPMGKPFYIERSGSYVEWEIFYESEIKVLKFLDEWCVRNYKKLVICGCEFENSNEESNFFSDSLSKCSWEYVPRLDSSSSYRLIDSAEIVVFIDSTMGYESIARGKKTASFSCRTTNNIDQFFTFGWPGDFPENGPFWTNTQNEIEFERVMNFINTITQDDWDSIQKQYTSDLIEFDSNNSKFSSLMEDILN